LAPSHIAEPAADHCPTRCRPAQNARHRESIEIENDGTANANNCGLEKDFCRTAHPFALKFWLDVSDRLWIDVDRRPDDDDTRVTVWFQGQEIPATFGVEDLALLSPFGEPLTKLKLVAAVSAPAIPACSRGTEWSVASRAEANKSGCSKSRPDNHPR